MKLAIFDFDGTLLRGNSWRLFYRWSLRRRPLRAPWLVVSAALRQAGLVRAESMQDQVAAGWRGLSRTEVATEAHAFYMEALKPRLRPKAMAELVRRRGEGCEIVVVSAAWDMLVAPFVLDQGIRHWTATPVAFEEDRCSGRLASPLLRGEAKREWLQTARFSEPVDWMASCAYGDEHADIPMLSLVGEPGYVMNPSGEAPPGSPAGMRLLDWR